MSYASSTLIYIIFPANLINIFCRKLKTIRVRSEAEREARKFPSIPEMGKHCRINLQFYRIIFHSWDFIVNSLTTYNRIWKRKYVL